MGPCFRDPLKRFRKGPPMLPAAPRFAFVDLDIPWEGDRLLTLACLQALDNQDLGVWVCDSQGGVEYLSRSFLEMVGMDLAESRNLGLIARLPPEDVPATLGKWRNCLEEGSPWDHVLRIRDRQGFLRHVLSWGGPLRDEEEGKRLAWVGVNLDVTAMKMGEPERRERRSNGAADGWPPQAGPHRQAGRGRGPRFQQPADRHQRLQRAGPFHGGGQEPGEPPRARIREAGQRAPRLTRQLLAFSRRQIMAPRMLDLNSMVQEAWGKLEGFLGPDIDKRFLPCPTATRIKADPSQVEQVLLNLAINAKEAMPQGGTLLVETARVELRPEELTWIRKRRPPVPDPTCCCGCGTRARAWTRRAWRISSSPFIPPSKPAMAWDCPPCTG